MVVGYKNIKKWVKHHKYHLSIGSLRLLGLVKHFIESGYSLLIVIVLVF